MGRYKKSFANIGFIIFLYIFLPLNLKGYEYIYLDGLIKDKDVEILKEKISKNQDIIISLNSFGGKLENIFLYLNLLQKHKLNNKKIYSVITGENVAYGGSFFIVLFSDIVFYNNVLNIGALTPLNPNIYLKNKDKFDDIFDIFDEKERLKTFFFYGELLNVESIASEKNKFIEISKLNDISYSLENIDITKLGDKSIDLFNLLINPNMFFILFNLNIILLFFSVYISKKNIYYLITVLLSFFIYNIFLNFPIRFDMLFTIFLAHFILLFRIYTTIKKTLTIISFGIFFISSIYIIEPINENFYLEVSYRVNIFVLIISFIFILIIYKISLYYLNKRISNFIKKDNTLISQTGFVVENEKELIIEIKQDKYSGISVNKLSKGDKVKVIDYKKLKLIVEIIDNN